jgi:integrase
MTKPRGRHPHHRLTAVKVNRINAAGRHADGNGLYLVVDPSGARRWILRTVVRGRRRDIGLGSTRLVTLAEARVRATQFRHLARSGGDPLAARRRERRPTLTFREAAKKVHESHAATFKNAKHRAQWLGSLEADVFPVFGDRDVDAVESPDVLKALAPIWTTKPETARRLKQRIKVVLDWAKASGHRTGDNAVEGVSKVLPKVRQTAAHHPALPYRDVPTFVHSVRAFKASQSIKIAFEFLILTAARTSEVLDARWEEIDLEARIWTVPANRIKAGREHRVPLSPRCLEILDVAKGMADGGPFVFPGRSPKTPLSNMAFLMLLRRMERQDITAHGFRSSFRDWAAEMRPLTPRAVVESALAHVVRDKTEAAYFRSDLFELRRELMTAWDAFATAEPTEVGKVLRMRA